MKLVELILYVGQRPLRAGRITLAVILWQSDFEAYWKVGESITEALYVKAASPGKSPPPQGVWAAVRDGWRWGGVQHRLMTGSLTRRDAEWIVAQWQHNGRTEIPV